MAKKVLFLLTVVALIVCYQLTSLGKMDSFLDQMGIKDKVKAMGLKPIPIEGILAGSSHLHERLSSLKKALFPYVPKPVKKWFTPIEIPAGLPDERIALLLEAAAADPKLGTKIATATFQGEELSPSFFLATNLPDGSSLGIRLEGKRGTLLNALKYEKSISVQVKGQTIRTPRFQSEQNKPLPRGEYILSVHKIGQAAPLLSESYFLGGQKDETYVQRLKEFNERIRQQILQEWEELVQVNQTLETVANESADKFFNVALNGPITLPRNTAWKKYHDQYLKMAEQVKNLLLKADKGSLENELILPQLYQKAAYVFALMNKLHETQNLFVERFALKKNARRVSNSPEDRTRVLEDIRAQAESASQALTEMKNALESLKTKNE